MKADSTDTLTVLKLLAKGRTPDFVAQATGTAIGYVQGIAGEHGWPDVARLQGAVDELMLDTYAPRIPVRAPEPSRPSPSPGSGPRPATAAGGTPHHVALAPHPQSSRPVPQPVTSTPPVPSPAPGGTPNGALDPPGFTVNDLVRACRRSEYKRTQALGPKLTELAEKITAALRAERETAEAKAKQAEAFIAKKAQVDRLAKQLADARAALRELKPTGVTEAALDFACGECGDLFATSQGRGMHTYCKHGAATSTPSETETRSATA